MDYKRRSILGIAAATAVPALSRQHDMTGDTLGPTYKIRHTEYLLESLNTYLSDEYKALKASSTEKTATYAVLNQSGGWLNFGPGVHDIYDTIEMGDGNALKNSTHAALKVTGFGCGANGGELDNLSAGTTLRWRGRPGLPMIRIFGPIYNVKIEGLTLDCSGIANGIEAGHPITSTFSELQIINPYQYGLNLRSVSAARSGMAVTAGSNIFRLIKVAQINPQSSGFIIGDNTTLTGGASGNIFEQCSVLGAGTGFRFRYTDYNRLVMCNSYYCRAPITIDPPSGGPGFPTAIYFDQWSADKGIEILPGWAPWPNTGFIFNQWHREWDGNNPKLDTSFGPLFPKDHRISGTDNLGNVYPHVR
jgi:hypothetical protein